ncbi:glycosyltransferase [Microbacterium sp. C5A9]|uniref:glycosyltransferase n=1 Tax=Microbacterium sp. C5A9 TaxID=2736663 RepID=UPI001F51E1E9|nr:glycosyltransferase [Microbacterium sp. C5A9]MCI1019188.1 glycosyltransferase [Microbacterium sp. C5A9]
MSSRRRTTSTSPITVLQSTNAPDGTTRYIDQIVTDASDATRFVYFSWSEALFGRWDAFHVHWPETLVTSPRPAVRAIKSGLVWVLVQRARLLRRPIVRTLHNLEPHEWHSRIEHAAMRLIDRHTTTFILINRHGSGEGPKNAVTIMHGHYRSRFASHPRSTTEPGLAIFFGMIKPYKNVGKLIEAFRGIPADGAHRRLRVVGKSDPQTRQQLTTVAADDDRVSFRFEFVDDESLVREVTAASLAVLPYTELYNSGVALVALSLGIPILVPASASATELAREVGEGWVHTFTGEIDSMQLAAALEAATLHPPTAEPQLDGRSWETVAAQHEAAYRQAIAIKRGDD